LQKRRSKLDIFHKKSEAMQQISKKVLLDAQEKKRKRRKKPNRFNYHNRVASNVVKTYYIYSVSERSVLLETKRREKNSGFLHDRSQ
jgi:cation transport regulator ChaB